MLTRLSHEVCYANHVRTRLELFLHPPSDPEGVINRFRLRLDLRRDPATDEFSLPRLWGDILERLLSESRLPCDDMRIGYALSRFVSFRMIEEGEG